MLDSFLFVFKFILAHGMSFYLPNNIARQNIMKLNEIDINEFLNLTFFSLLRSLKMKKLHEKLYADDKPCNYNLHTTKNAKRINEKQDINLGPLLS